jgi:hypothetical protein
MPNRGGFSWKRVTGISAAKARVSRKTGIPLTKSGRQRKVGWMLTGGGCLTASLSLSSLLVAVLLAVVACGGSDGAVPFVSIQPSPAATDTCGQDVADANANRHDITALDQAIVDCPSVAALKAAIAANPGYLDPGVSVEEFAANRCAADVTLVLVGSPVCEELATTSAEAGDLTVKKVSLTESVPRNGTAKVTIKTAPKARCSIDVEYKSGPSTASGLGDKTADSTGKVSWSWKVGGRTTPGRWPIYIDCAKGDREGSLSLTFRVT